MKRAAGLAALLVLFLAITLALRPASYAAPRLIPGMVNASESSLRIVAFGTSLTALYEWPAVLEARLSDCLHRQVQVEVIARPGAGTTWARNQLDRVAAARPDLIMIEFAINDADLIDGVSLRTSSAQHRQILTGLRDALPQAGILLMTTNPVQGLQRFKRPQLVQYYRLYSHQSETFGTGLLHLSPHWAGYDIPDGMHPRDPDATAVIVPNLSALIAQSLGQDDACGTG